MGGSYYNKQEMHPHSTASPGLSNPLDNQNASPERRIEELNEQLAALSAALENEQQTRQHLVEKLNLVQKELDESNTLQIQFIDNLGHELRTPLNGILGMTQLMLDMPLNAVLREYTETVDKSGQALKKIISSFLEYTQISQALIEPDEVEFDIESSLETFFQPFIETSFGRDIAFFSLFEGNVKTVSTDLPRVLQILEILLNNAAKFTESGHIHVKIDASGVDVAEPGVLSIQVSDSGIGIESSILESIFEPFRQGDGSSTRTFGGLGIGLALCEKLVDLLEGSIEVSSVVGQGSTFSVTLPVKVAALKESPSITLPPNLRLGIVTPSQLTYQIVERYVIDARAESLRWLHPSEVTSESLQSVDILLVDHPVDRNSPPFFPPPAVRKAGRLARPRMIALVPPGTVLEGSFRAWYDVIERLPVHRQSLLEAIDFALLMIDLDAPPPVIPATEDFEDSAKRPNFLIVEPVRVNQKILTRMLDTIGFGSKVVESLEELPELLAAQNYQGILFNPQADPTPSFSTLKAALNELNGSPVPNIIAISGKTYEWASLREAGISNQLSIPLKIESLREALENVMHGSSVFG